MTVPPKRKPRNRTRKGRSHQALKKITLSSCQKCKQPVLPHRVCANCGFYNGKEVIKVKTKLDKQKKEKKEKQEE